MSGLFGGSKDTEQSTSSNQAYGNISSAYSGLEGDATTGSNALSALLSGDSSGLTAYKNATGFNQQALTGSQGITGNAAAAGMLRSGATDKALQSYGDNLENQYASQYTNDLMNQANLGFQAGSLISGAGTTSQGTKNSSTKPGISKLLGGVVSGGAIG